MYFYISRPHNTFYFYLGIDEIRSGIHYIVYAGVEDFNLLSLCGDEV